MSPSGARTRIASRRQARGSGRCSSKSNRVTTCAQPLEKGSSRASPCTRKGRAGGCWARGVVAQIQPHRPAAGAPDRLRQVAVGTTQLQQQARRLECIQQLDPGIPVRMRASVTLGRVPAGSAVEVVVIVEVAVSAEAGRIVRTSPPGSHGWPARYHAAQPDTTPPPGASWE